MAEQEPPIKRHKFVGQYGLGNKFCAYPIGLYQCGQDRKAFIHLQEDGDREDWRTRTKYGPKGSDY